MSPPVEQFVSFSNNQRTRFFVASAVSVAKFPSFDHALINTVATANRAHAVELMKSVRNFCFVLKDQKICHGTLDSAGLFLQSFDHTLLVTGFGSLLPESL